MKTTTLLAVALLFLLSGFAMAADNDELKNAQSKDKRIQITLPKGWETTDFPPSTSKRFQDRSIVAKSPEGDVVVMSEPKDESVFSTLKNFAEASMKVLMKDPRFEDKVLTDLRTIKINGAEALQSGMHGTFQKTRHVFVNTFFDSPTRWTHIEVSTEQSRLAKVQDQIDAINKSFKELPTEQQPKVRVLPAADDSKIAKSKDMRIQVTLPSGWESEAIPAGPLTERYITANCADKVAKVVITSAVKEDFKAKSVQEFAQEVMKTIDDKPMLEDLVITGPKSFKISGAEAVQYGVHGTFKGTRMVLIKTFIESPTRWNAIVVTGPQSRLDSLQNDIDAINKTFKELPKEQQSKDSPPHK